MGETESELGLDLPLIISPGDGDGFEKKKVQTLLPGKMSSCFTTWQADRMQLLQIQERIMNGQAMPEITATELKQRLDNGDDIQIVDVREDNEVAIAKLPNSIHIPLAQVLNRMSEIDPARETVVHCKMGGRSARAIDALKRSGFTGNLLNLAGGITAWSNDVDPSVPKY